MAEEWEASKQMRDQAWDEWELAWQAENITLEEAFQQAMWEYWGQMEALEEHHIALLEWQAKSQALIAMDTDRQVLDAHLCLAGAPMPPGAQPPVPAPQGPWLPPAIPPQHPPRIWEEILWHLQQKGPLP